MSTECPRCKKPLFLEVHTIQTFTVKEIGMVDVVPDEAIDAERYSTLKCLACSFEGWTNEYNEESRGVIRIFGKRGKKHERNIEDDPEIA